MKKEIKIIFAGFSLLLITLFSVQCKKNATPAKVEVETPAPTISVADNAEVDAYVGFCDPNLPPNYCFGGSMTIQAFNQNGIGITPTHVFIIYWDKDKRLALGRRSITGGEWTTIKFSDVLPDVDSHRTPSLGISPENGTIHLIYGQHNDELRYRVSEANAATSPAFNETLFSPKSSKLNPGEDYLRVTYPSFVVGANNKLLVFWRSGSSGNGDTYRSVYAASSGWSPSAKIITGTGNYNGSTSRNAYWNDIVVRNDRVYLTWCWREDSGGTNSNHDLNYAYSDDNGQTWYNDAGALVGNGGTSIMNIGSPGLMISSIRGFNMANNAGAAVDGSGRVHTVSRFETIEGSGQSTYYHIWKNASGTWVRKKLSLPLTHNSYGRPKIFANGNTNDVYIVGVVNKKLTVYMARASETYQNWIQVYAGSIDYHSDINGYITPSGDLYVYAHRRPSAPSGTVAKIDLIRF